MPKNRDEDNEAEAANLNQTASNDMEVDELDLDDLDLSVETVEERISPSETNVFDK